jgi:hypothetical protein
MTALLIKAALSGIIIAIASHVARTSSLLGAVIISLPLTSLLGILWLYRDTRDIQAVSEFSWSILILVPPSLCFFVILPLALKVGAGFWVAFSAAILVTIAAYALWTSVLS